VAEFREILVDVDSLELYGEYHITIFIPSNESHESLMKHLGNSRNMITCAAYKSNSRTNRIKTTEAMDAIIQYFKFPVESGTGLVVFSGFERAGDYGINKLFRKVVRPPKEIKEYSFIVSKRFDTKRAREFG